MEWRTLLGRTTRPLRHGDPPSVLSTTASLRPCSHTHGIYVFFKPFADWMRLLCIGPVIAHRDIIKALPSNASYNVQLWEAAMEVCVTLSHIFSISSR